MVKFYFYYLVMNVGKIIMLLQSVYNYYECGMCMLIFMLVLDNCFGEGVVVLCIGLKVNVCCFSGEENLLMMVECDIEMCGVLYCVFVDEVQFLFKVQVWQISDVVDWFNILVFVYGLCIDFCGELFEGSCYLLVWVDNFEEIKMICYIGCKVIMVVCVDVSGCVVIEGLQVEIGGNDCYVLVSCVEFKYIIEGCGSIELQQSVLLLGEQLFLQQLYFFF